MIAIIGLGNPGIKYKDTRHNVGFFVIDAVANEGFALQEKASFSLFTGRISDKRVVLVKPQSYMNNSGMLIAQINTLYKITPQNMFVFHDDMDVSIGKVKYSLGGSGGGHNGIRSINAHTNNGYHRIRIGIGRPADNHDCANYVLSDFESSEKEIINSTVSLLANSITEIISDPVSAISALMKQSKLTKDRASVVAGSTKEQ